MQPQGGAARAAQLIQQQYGQAASASVNAMQRGSGLALPGGKQENPPSLHLPGQQYSPQHQQALRQQQQQLQQQQAQPRIKLENESPRLAQGSFPQPNYGQTDGAGDDAFDQWQILLAQRRALHAEHGDRADRMMRDQVLQSSAELQSGLMMPLDELPSNKRLKRTITSSTHSATASGSSIPQFDGLADDEDEEKPEIKDEVDSDVINSDLDDDDDGQGELGEDDDEQVDTILCTYDKVQRVKNKWKCTLKDGIMSANGKEWVFAKGMGEFEW
jgi:transcription initiation factor TFIIA large subunit